ncbi:uncharacterized protein LOC112574111 [Pomacea canaliculata]|uniref:uncharacterized protein LOC112574111 n=1 Tax=Pomacea canaliculata TaxID=400727 RepID=UPI000D73861B|nr:uncharacterized protein LOC112574111 [Pomacea canaliculata]
MLVSIVKETFWKTITTSACHQISERYCESAHYAVHYVRCGPSAASSSSASSPPASSYFQQAMMALDNEYDSSEDTCRDSSNSDTECTECSRQRRSDAMATLEQHALANGEVTGDEDNSALRVTSPVGNGDVRCGRCAARSTTNGNSSIATVEGQSPRLARRKSSTDKGVQWADEQNKQLAREQPPKRRERKPSVTSVAPPRPILKHP